MDLKNSKEVFKYYSHEWATGFNGIEIWTHTRLHAKGSFRLFPINKTIKQDDWIMLDEFIRDYKINSIIEFGTGLSTLLFSFLGCQIDSYDTNERYLTLVNSWINKYNNRANITYHTWENKVMFELDKIYDLCIVDGALPRDAQLDVGLHYAKYVFIHDSPQFKARLAKLSTLEEIGKTKRGYIGKNTFKYTKVRKKPYWGND